MGNASCPACGSRLESSRASKFLDVCVDCDARVVAAGATHLPFPKADALSEIPLTAEFRAAYRMGRLLGTGAMGAVFQAEQLSTGRPVAIKFLLDAEDPKLVARFRREARTLAAIDHPHVMGIYDTGVAERHPYLVTELLLGGTLAERVARGPLDVVTGVTVVRQLLSGLAVCHAAGVVHRDLKPANIIFDGSRTSPGVPKIADLGIARHFAADRTRMTQTGMILGTPLYMAPEQLDSAEVGPAADLYAMALMLCQLLVGQVPLRGRHLVDMLELRLAAGPCPEIDTLPADLAQIVRRALAPAPADRPTIEAVEAELDSVLARFAGASASTAIAPVRQPPGAVSASKLPQPSRERKPSRPSARPVPERRRARIVRLALAAASAIALGAALLIVSAVRQGPAGVGPPCRVLASPAVIAGQFCANIRWTTDRPAPTAVWIWPAGAPESAGRLERAANQAAGGSTLHELNVRGLWPERTWNFRAVLSESRRDMNSGSIELRNGTAGLVDDVATKFVDPRNVEIAFRLGADLTVGAFFQSGGPRTPVWAPSRRTGAVVLRLWVDAPGELCQPVLCFKEIEDQVPLPTFPGPLLLRQRLIPALGRPWRKELMSLAADLLQQAARHVPIQPGRVPARSALARLDERARAKLMEDLMRTARRRLDARWSERGFTLDQALGQLALARTDPDVTGDARRRLFRALMRLEDLDALGELLAGAPLLAVDRALGLRLERPGTDPPTTRAFQPLDDERAPCLQGLTREHSMLLLSHADDSLTTALASEFVPAGDNPILGFSAAAARQALPASEELRHQEGIWQPLPPLPAGFPSDGPLRLVVGVAAATAQDRLWVRIGQAEVALRVRPEDDRWSTKLSFGASRAQLLERTVTMAMDLPAGFVEPGARDLAVHLERLPLDELNQVLPVRAWLTQFAVIPRR